MIQKSLGKLDFQFKEELQEKKNAKNLFSYLQFNVDPKNFDFYSDLLTFWVGN